jgi:hypothetical protein
MNDRGYSSGRWSGVLGDAMSDDSARDFFISYTAADEAWAKWIAVTLDGAGYTTLLQAWDFRPGSDFIHQMQNATRNAARTVAVLSPAYLCSRFGEAEWRAAFARDPTGERGLLLPLRVKACEPPGLLATRVYIDVVDVDEATARERLLGGVAAAGAHPTSTPFPGAIRARPEGAVRFPGTGPDRTSAVRRQIRAHPIASSQLSELQALEGAESCRHTSWRVALDMSCSDAMACRRASASPPEADDPLPGRTRLEVGDGAPRSPRWPITRWRSRRAAGPLDHPSRGAMASSRRARKLTARSRACSNTTSADAIGVWAGQRPVMRDRVPIICGSPARGSSSRCR